ncbi:MAG: hypothetical protein V1761_04995 [bacterium]
MSDAVLKAIVTIAAMYAALNPLFRYHNVADGIDTIAAVAIFGALFAAIGATQRYAVVWCVLLIIATAVIIKAILAGRKIKFLVVFGIDRNHFQPIHELILDEAEKAGIPETAVAHFWKWRFLVRIDGASKSMMKTFAKALDKSLKTPLGFVFVRVYPSIVAALLFVALVWRFL